ncbi:9690_t:CDS:2, partial [Racocetra persica]
KLIREGYKYADRLSDYLEDIGTMYIGEFALDPLADFYYLAIIPPLSILASRSDICKKFPISNLIQTNYSSDNLSAIEITWEHEETKAWRNEVLMKFFYHPNLAPSKYRPGALCDTFTKTNSTYHFMSAIATKFVTDHKLTNEMSLEELSRYAPEILELLTTGVPK